MNNTNKPLNPKSCRKDFRASEDELLRLEQHCTNRNLKQSDFIRAAIQEKIERDTAPLAFTDPLATNTFYNLAIRRSITKPTIKQLVDDFKGGIFNE
ncbi:MAG: hypothetical protein E7286_02495 [Lachnospiraceae bacterium]|nr:hypothetical protein [Lachnospiraceae bacterium]